MLPNKQSTPSFEGHHGRGQELLAAVQDRRRRVLMGSENTRYCEERTPDVALEARQEDELAARRALREQKASPAAAVAVGASVEAADEAARQALIAYESNQPSILDDETGIPGENVVYVDFVNKTRVNEARQNVVQAQAGQMPYGEEQDAAIA